MSPRRHCLLCWLPKPHEISDFRYRFLGSRRTLSSSTDSCSYCVRLSRLPDAQVALAVLKLLLLMPAKTQMAELRGFLMRVVATLSSRNQGLRQQGRETLGKVVLELGAKNFGGAPRNHVKRDCPPV